MELAKRPRGSSSSACLGPNVSGRLSLFFVEICDEYLAHPWSTCDSCDPSCWFVSLSESCCCPGMQNGLSSNGSIAMHAVMQSKKFMWPLESLDPVFAFNEFQACMRSSRCFSQNISSGVHGDEWLRIQRGIKLWHDVRLQGPRETSENFCCHDLQHLLANRHIFGLKLYISDIRHCIILQTLIMEITKADANSWQPSLGVPGELKPRSHPPSPAHCFRAASASLPAILTASTRNLRSHNSSSETYGIQCTQ